MKLWTFYYYKFEIQILDTIFSINNRREHNAQTTNTKKPLMGMIKSGAVRIILGIT